MCCTRIMADATTTQAEEMTEEEAALLKRLSAKFAGAAMTCMFRNARGKKRCFDEIDRILRVRSQEFMGCTRVINAACLLDSAATQQDFLLQNNLNQSRILQNALPNYCFFFPLQRHLHFLIRLTLNHNFCCTNTNRKQTCLHFLAKAYQNIRFMLPNKAYSFIIHKQVHKHAA